MKSATILLMTDAAWDNIERLPYVIEAGNWHQVQVETDRGAPMNAVRGLDHTDLSDEDVMQRDPCMRRRIKATKAVMSQQ